MTFEEANKRIEDPTDTEAMSAFGCTYFHPICLECKNGYRCRRKERYIKGCNFYSSKEERDG